MMIATLAITMTACGKKKNGSASTPAAAPAPTVTATCNYDSTAGQWKDQNGAVCTPTNNTTTCTWNASANQWKDQNGAVCTPNVSGPCGYWTNYYHVYYVPVNVPVSSTFPTGLACVNVNYLNSYAYNTHYYNNYDYYYYNPPNTCYGSDCNSGGNQNCSTSIDLSFLGSGFGVGFGLCF